MYRSHPADALLQLLNHVFPVSDTASDEDGVDFAAQHSALLGDSLGNVINHGVDDELSVLIAIVHHLLGLNHVGGAQV